MEPQSLVFLPAICPMVIEVIAAPAHVLDPLFLFDAVSVQELPFLDPVMICPGDIGSAEETIEFVPLVLHILCDGGWICDMLSLSIR